MKILKQRTLVELSTGRQLVVEYEASDGTFIFKAPGSRPGDGKTEAVGAGDDGIQEAHEVSALVDWLDQVQQQVQQ